MGSIKTFWIPSSVAWLNIQSYLQVNDHKGGMTLSLPNREVQVQVVTGGKGNVSEFGRNPGGAT